MNFLIVFACILPSVLGCSCGISTIPGGYFFGWTRQYCKETCYESYDSGYCQIGVLKNFKVEWRKHKSDWRITQMAYQMCENGQNTDNDFDRNDCEQAFHELSRNERREVVKMAQESKANRYSKEPFEIDSWENDDFYDFINELKRIRYGKFEECINYIIRKGSRNRYVYTSRGHTDHRDIDYGTFCQQNMNGNDDFECFHAEPNRVEDAFENVYKSTYLRKRNTDFSLTIFCCKPGSCRDSPSQLEAYARRNGCLAKNDFDSEHFQTLALFTSSSEQSYDHDNNDYGDNNGYLSKYYKVNRKIFKDSWQRRHNRYYYYYR